MARFSPTLVDHFHDPRNRGELTDPSGIGHGGTSGAGPSIVFYIKADNDAVSAASFTAAGCGVTIASGSALTELVVGRRIQDCLALTAREISQALDGIPADKSYCPQLAIEALRAALSDAQARSSAEGHATREALQKNQLR